MAIVYKLDFPTGKSYIGITRGTLTEEHRAKLKAARNSRPPVSAETRAKMSAAHKARHQRGVTP